MTQTVANPIVVFDLGGVLFDWNPDYLFRELIPDAGERAWFLSEVCNPDWNIQQDAGRSLAEATATLSARHPAYAEQIAAFYGRWPETLRGTLVEGMAIFETLEDAGIPLYALTNWSAETFPYAWERYPFMQRFKDVLVSGRELLIKPDPRIYALMLERIRVHHPDAQPAQLIFIDDSLKNADGARACGWHAIHHTDPAETTAQLRAWGLPL
ncbi:2-haloacid dehalogenase [Andreprevotia lacus DSM 23236]|jgi:2-haloacid dehalogenase|uniref:2-haloacid dehalogenase n=1 Tax=Andreprevotia lacus DSM 23236 TaxID=1121001 RepID=A0A1W1X3D9_9NEIS|nr:HAD family phosphatase [Andreprevotia lacus]SMC17921.1 2-haloacid dehalogenase [Andreprevotia lacus DSM 23236]